MDILKQESIKVCKTFNKAPIKPVFFMPMLAPPGQLVFPTNSLSNLCQGVAYRNLRAKVDGTFVELTKPTINFRSEYARFTRKLVACCPFVKPMSVDDYLLSCDPKRRRRYGRIAGLAYRTRSGNPRQFVKLEPADKSVKQPVCRIITDPGPKHNLELGCYIKPAEHAIMVGLERYRGHKVVMKGMNALEIGADLLEAWESYTKPVCISGDAIRFDAHTGVEVRDGLEFEVYRKLFNDVCLNKLLRKALVRKVTAKADDGRLSYILKQRGSGYHNTGIGNSLITAAMLIVYVELYNIRAHVKDNGDDWLMILDASDLDKLSGLGGWLLSNGYPTEITDPVTNIEEIEFCQTHPVLGPDGYVMVRDPRTARLKDLFTTKVRTEKEFRSWAACVAECGLASSSGIPIFQEFYTAVARTAKGAKPGVYFDEYSGRRMLSRGLTYRRVEVSATTRLSFWKAFGYTPDEQEALEQEYRRSGVVEYTYTERVSHMDIRHCDTTNPPSCSF